MLQKNNTVDDLFSDELKELISKSRDIAIKLGYDYISTVHFFIADCERNTGSSILNFCFSNHEEFEKFKTGYTLDKPDLPGLVNEVLPLTTEAEKTIHMMESERMFRKQTEAYPCHIFIAALKNKESLLFQCFTHDEDALDALTKYYEILGEFERSKMTTDQIANEYYVPKKRSKNGFLKRIARYFKGRS